MQLSFKNSYESYILDIILIMETSAFALYFLMKLA